MAESGEMQRTISAENVSSWTRDLSGLILLQRARVVNLKSTAEVEEAKLKLESQESLLKDAIIAQDVRYKKLRSSTAASSEIYEAYNKLESLKSRLREAIIDQGARVRKLERTSENEAKAVAVRRLESLKADHKAATGSEWSEVRAEGPILLTTNTVRGREILPEFRETLKELKRNNIIGEYEKILVVTGTHGDPPINKTQSGVSGLKDKNKLDHGFYFEDCQQVGVVPGPRRAAARVPIEAWDWDRVPEITKPAKVMESPPPGSFYADKELKKMDIRLANMAYYFGHEQKLLDDITKFDPALMILSFCYSMNSDLSFLLRSRGVFGLMLVRHDLRLITERSSAELNLIQRELFRHLVENSPFICLFVYGSAGSGKTMMVTEGFKIKLGQLLRQGRRVRLLVTTFSGLQSNPTELKKKIETQYLVNIRNIEVMGLEDLCENELGIDYDVFNPFETVTNVISSLSETSEPDLVNLILIDEVPPCGSDQTDPNWRELQVKPNVIFLLGISPIAEDATSTKLLPPQNNSICSRHLTYKHRNCPPIRDLYEYFVQDHEKESHLSMADDQEVVDNQLPSGLTPIWIELPEYNVRKSHSLMRKMLARVAMIPEIEKYRDNVIVLGTDFGNEEGKAAQLCKRRGWRYYHADNITGCEAKCVVLLACPLTPEFITRGINMLVILSRDSDNKIKSAVEFGSKSGKTIIEQYEWETHRLVPSEKLKDDHISDNDIPYEEIKLSKFGCGVPLYLAVYIVAFAGLAASIILLVGSSTILVFVSSQPESNWALIPVIDMFYAKITKYGDTLEKLNLTSSNTNTEENKKSWFYRLNAVYIITSALFLIYFSLLLKKIRTKVQDEVASFIKFASYACALGQILSCLSLYVTSVIPLLGDDEELLHVFFFLGVYAMLAILDVIMASLVIYGLWRNKIGLVMLFIMYMRVKLVISLVITCVFIFKNGNAVTDGTTHIFTFCGYNVTDLLAHIFNFSGSYSFFVLQYTWMVHHSQKTQKVEDSDENTIVNISDKPSVSFELSVLR